jgi:glycosyltransferase involved in cell wall biosynthesis
LIENCDFQSFPPGGQLTFSRHLLRHFGARLALVGATCTDDLVGRWIERRIQDHTVAFLPVGRLEPGSTRPLMPRRLRFYLQLSRHRRAILAGGARHAIILAPEALLAVRDWDLEICYHFSGVENPLVRSRYWWARPLARWFDTAHLRAASQARLVMAHADAAAIDALVARSGGLLPRERILVCPTCVDTLLFQPRAQQPARQTLGLPVDLPLFLSAGRINAAKGWSLLLDAFRQYRHDGALGLLCFVGDGEDRSRLERAARALGLEADVRITGFQKPEAMPLYYNAADVVVFGSHREGWSNAMLEALACGKPIVSTAVSGAADLIQDGRNGFVLAGRDPRAFARAMQSALALPEAEAVSVGIACRYSVEGIGALMRDLWPALRGGEPVPQGEAVHDR